jgi:hypothetical protein
MCKTLRPMSFAALVLLAASSASAQLPGASARDLSVGVGSFPLHTIDFDLWCQQTQRYAAERCSARRPEDVKAFEDYRSSIERYEIDHLKQVQKEEDFRARANRDPMQTVKGKQDGLP